MSYIPIVQWGSFVVCVVMACGPSVTADRGCVKTVIRGKVATGDRFTAPFDRDLVFRLSPHADAGVQGWTIEVVPRSDPSEDYVVFATPPFHSDNDRYLDTSYGHTAADAVAKKSRHFKFALTSIDNAGLRAGVDAVLYGQSEAAIKSAQATLNSIRTGQGVLRIVKAKVTTGTAAQESGTIESLQFRAELCVPR